MRLALVIAHFQEDLSWVRDVPGEYEITVYGKGGQTAYEGPVKALPNVGRESHTYLHHIVENYDSLPDWTVFSQGWPFDHSKGFMGLLADPEDFKKPYLGGRGFRCLGHTWTTTADKLWNDKRGQFMVKRNECMRAFWSMTNPGVPFPRVIKTGWGAILGVSRRAIRRRPVTYYESLRDLHFSESTLPFVLELLWSHVFIPAAVHRECQLLL